MEVGPCCVHSDTCLSVVDFLPPQTSHPRACVTGKIQHTSTRQVRYPLYSHSCLQSTLPPKYHVNHAEITSAGSPGGESPSEAAAVEEEEQELSRGLVLDPNGGAASEINSAQQSEKDPFWLPPEIATVPKTKCEAAIQVCQLPNSSWNRMIATTAEVASHHNSYVLTLVACDSLLVCLLQCQLSWLLCCLSCKQIGDLVWAPQLHCLPAASPEPPE